MPVPLLSSLLFLAACGTDPAPAPRIRINEVMAGNDGVVLDPADPVCPEADDWIELVNAGPVAGSLRGLVLVDDDGRFPLPDRVLAPGEHLVIWADDQPGQGDLHAPFRIDADGAHLELQHAAGALDAVDVPAVDRDHSWARVTDGELPWVELTSPTPGAPNQRVLSDDPCFRPALGFEDHAWPCLSEDASYDLLADGGTVVKFAIFAFDDPTERRIAFMDSAFYTLHDQYYLFHAFNGEPFEGLRAYPPFHGDFRTWGELDRWAASVHLEALVPPFQARFAGERLWSPYFYDTVNGDDRVVGVGTLQHLPATATRDEVWAFDLEYADAIDHAALVIYFETLQAHGPPGFADLHWLVRSPEQEALATTMAEQGLAYADRVLRYEDLTDPGAIEVYHPGLTAGRVRLLDPTDPLTEARTDDILVLQTLPDELPPCAALITTVPQTELSHVALLAASRGIPNLHVEGLATDPLWVAWDRRPTWVAVEATRDGGFRAAELDEATYTAWLDGQVDQPPVLSPPDPDTLPWAMALEPDSDMLALRPAIGGKAAGLVGLLATPGVDTPDTPLALSIRGYHAHVDALTWLPELLEAAPFLDPADVSLRYLVLHGHEAYLERYATAPDAAEADVFLAAHPDDLLGELARTGGVVGAVADTPMPDEVALALRAALDERFAWLPYGQGLRVRSSSTVEDLEGFNGAGLYTSESGGLAPVGDDAPIEEAIRSVWASYWGAEAYEERMATGIDPLLGGMGLLVHPRFDDAEELANGVLTAQRQPDGSLEVLVNAQHGATSVVSPPDTCPAVRPERVRMHDRDGELVVEVLEASSLVSADTQVLDDAQRRTLFEQAGAVVDGWIATENAAVAPERARAVLTLDIEWREMAAGWPGGTSATDRLVLKQARSLDPGIGGLPDDIAALPAPIDLLARVHQVERLTCASDDLALVVTGLTTDPDAAPDMGYSDLPFVVTITAEALDDIASLGWAGGESVTWSHLALDEVVWADGFLSAQVPQGHVVIDPAGALELDDGTWSGAMTCEVDLLWSTPDGLLSDSLEPLVDSTQPK